MYKNTFVREKITVNNDAKTGNKLNHNWEVVIFESIGIKFVLFLKRLIIFSNMKIAYQGKREIKNLQSLVLKRI